MAVLVVLVLVGLVVGVRVIVTVVVLVVVLVGFAVVVLEALVVTMLGWQKPATQTRSSAQSL